ncbi:MAG: hypothetical protein ACI4GA_05680 [Acutalibacteraceae bacterium]
MCNLFGGNSCTWIIVLLILFLICENGGLFGGCCEHESQPGPCGCGCM